MLGYAPCGQMLLELPRSLPVPWHMVPELSFPWARMVTGRFLTVL